MRLRVRAQKLPTIATAIALVLLYGSFSALFPRFFSARVMADLFTTNAHVGIIAVGLTFVILSGGIDLSVGGVLGFTTVLVGVLIENRGVPPVAAIVLGLAAGGLLGTLHGVLIQRYQLPPFLVTLAGMFLANGLAFAVHSQSVAIRHPFYESVSDFGLPITETAMVRATSLTFLAVLAIGIVVAYGSRFGRVVYAMGGNEHSAVLMGLPVGRTKIQLYALSGFCSALAGVVFTFQTRSGDPTSGQGLELDAIAAVVIGGTRLTGGVGGPIGTLMGVLIAGIISVGLDFHGGFDSSWQRIAIGGMLLVFIGLQRFLARAAPRISPR